MKTLEHIYNQLQDEKSKDLFEKRLMYYLTKDYKYMQSIISGLDQKRELDRLVAECKRHIDDLVIYGAGNDLLILSGLYPDFHFKCICDRSEEKQKNGWRGIPVISPETLAERKESAVVAINTSGFHKEIYAFLKDNGFKDEQIINFGVVTDSLYASQYFDKDIMEVMPEDVFIDGGCYNCDTDEKFIEWCGGNYNKIYAFEPEKENYEQCLELCKRKNLQRIEILNKGLWSEATTLSFAANLGQGSKIAEDTQGDVVKIETASIDEVVGEETVSFIKLDIEGAELEALKGAKNTILRDKPRLAICIYHKPEDVAEILEYILSLHPDYKLFIRHYQMSVNETIVYAI